jgi:hypothetical protein
LARLAVTVNDKSFVAPESNWTLGAAGETETVHEYTYVCCPVPDGVNENELASAAGAANASTASTKIPVRSMTPRLVLPGFGQSAQRRPWLTTRFTFA